jgi:hypothetical protein
MEERREHLEGASAAYFVHPIRTGEHPVAGWVGGDVELRRTTWVTRRGGLDADVLARPRSTTRTSSRREASRTEIFGDCLLASF